MKKLLLVLLVFWVGTANAQISQITWINSRNGATGNATGTLPNWTISNIPLEIGDNLITVTYTNVNGTASDTITVTDRPNFPGAALVGAWGFEEGTGLVAADSSGVGNNGSLINGPTWVTGKFGTALQFNGTTQSVNVPDSNTLDWTESFAITAWVMPQVTRSDFRAVLVKNYTQFLYGVFAGFGASCIASWPIAGFSEQDVSSVLCDTQPLAPGVWTHIAVTYDYDVGTMVFYRNGVQTASLPVQRIIPPSTENLQIGASKFGEYWEGRIDEVRVYNKLIPVSAGLNTVMGAPCGYADYTSQVVKNFTLASVRGDANCPVGGIVAPPIVPVIRIPAAASGLKTSGSFRFGQQP